MHTTAFVLSLIAGILMLVSGIFAATWFMAGGSNWSTYGGQGMMGGGWGGMMSGFGSMMNGYGSMMQGFGVPLGMMGGFSIIGFIAGIIVIIGAIMLNVRPTEHFTWGIIILIFSIVSLMGMGGFYIGALLGIAGGALAISYRTSKTT